MIIAHHIAKTGGTSLMHHVRDRLGKDAFFGVGLHTAAERFFKGQPLWEELPAGARDKVTLTLGHHVGLAVVDPLPGDTPIAFFVCWRDPVAHALSQFHHSERGQAQKGRAVDIDQSIDARTPNALARDVWDAFRGLVPWAEFSEASVLRLLSMFDYIAVTEDMAASTAPLCAALGIPPLTRRDRVAPQQTDLTDQQRQRILDKSPIDAAIHAMLTAQKRSDTPLAFDAALKAERLSAYRARLPGENYVERAYRALAGFLEQEGRLEAAQLYLSLAGADDRKFEPIWMREVPAAKLTDPYFVARSDYAKALVYRQFDHIRLAEGCLRRALALKPNFPLAKAALARILSSVGYHGEARRLAGEVADLFPQDHNLQKILTHQ